MLNKSEAVFCDTACDFIDIGIGTREFVRQHVASTTDHTGNVVRSKS